mgnify:CR=1 FL=1
MLIRTPKEKKRVIHYTAAQEAYMDKKIEQHFRSQRELPNGRSFLWERSRFELENDVEAFRQNFDRIKWNDDPPGKGI